MASTPPTYRRLPGRGAGLASYTRLYEAPDHLLQVTSTGWSESYKRFFYRDIQMVTLRRTRHLNVYTGVLGGLTLLFALPGGLAVQANGGPAAFFFVMAGIFLVAMIVNLLLGPTCACYLHTAVQTERLASVSRVRRARRLLARLKLLVESAQGQLGPEQLSARLTEAWRAAAFEASHPAGAQPGAANVPAPTTVTATTPETPSAPPPESPAGPS